MLERRREISLLERTLNEKGRISFSTRRELISSTADIVAFNYLEYLEFWKCTAMDDWEESAYWKARIDEEVDTYQTAVKKAIEMEAEKTWFGRQRRTIKISARHKKVIKFALRVIERDVDLNVMPVNVTYVMDLKRNTLRQITW